MSAAATAPQTSAPRPELLRVRDFDPQRSAEYFKRHGRKPFAPNFISHLIGIVLNTENEDHDRVMAWVLLMANGNFSDYAVDLGGNPLGQTDCARALGLLRQRVYEAVLYLEARFRLRREGRALYPVDDPLTQAEAVRAAEFSTVVTTLPDNGRIRGETTRREFRRIFESQHPRLAKHRAKARAILKHIERLEMRAYDEFVSSQPSRTNDAECHDPSGQIVTAPSDDSSQPSRTNQAHYIKEELINSSEGRVSTEESVFEGEPSSSIYAENLTTTRPSPESSPGDEALVREAVAEVVSIATPTVVSQLITACRQGTPDATGAEIAAAVRAKADLIHQNTNKNPVGYLLRVVAEVFQGSAIRNMREVKARGKPSALDRRSREREEIARWRKEGWNQ